MDKRARMERMLPAWMPRHTSIVSAAPIFRLAAQIQDQSGRVCPVGTLVGDRRISPITEGQTGSIAFPARRLSPDRRSSRLLLRLPCRRARCYILVVLTSLDWKRKR